MTFEEANSSTNDTVNYFGLEYAWSLCEHCVHWKECVYSDYRNRDYGIDLIIKCNFYEEE